MFSTVFGPPKIATANYATNKNVEIKHKRFTKLLEKEGRSSEQEKQGIRFIVNQLATNKSVYDDIFSKSRLRDTDTKTVDVFYNAIKGLFDVLIPDTQASLRDELRNYNDFLHMFYKIKLREKQVILSQYERQQARTAAKATKTFADAKTKFMKLGMTEAQANAEIAKAMPAQRNIIPFNPVADDAVDMRVAKALNDLFAKMETLPIRSDILRTAKKTLNPDMSNQKHNVSNTNVNRYLANLQMKQTANMYASMPMPPTTVPKLGGGGGGGKRKTRKMRVNLRKTRKMRKERKTRRA